VRRIRVKILLGHKSLSPPPHTQYIVCRALKKRGRGDHFPICVCACYTN